ncbi:MAG: hypothetical protein HMLKMBBP_03266 [Planctomycetes bacterium]|nr:hypothetical protein [Planctomycetota bacterium]
MNVLVVEADTDPHDPLWADLAEAGHAARGRAEAGISRGGVTEESWVPDVVLVRLDRDAAAVLDDAASILRTRRMSRAAVLFTGGNELALASARRRFPEANFARADQVLTALASIESED